MGGVCTALAGWAGAEGIVLPSLPAYASQSFHLFYLLLPDLARRQSFIAHLRARGIMAVFHYVPLHLSEMGRQAGGRPGQCPVTEEMSDRLVRLPLYGGLSDSDQAEVIDACRTFSAGAA